MRKFTGIKRLPLILILLWLGSSASLSALAVEKLTDERVAALLPQFFRMHLKQRDMDMPFTKRLLKEYVKQLDPVRSFFFKSEADTIINQSEQDLQRLATEAMNADFTFYKKVLQDYLDTQIARNAALYDGLDKRLDEIKARLKNKPPVAAQSENKTGPNNAASDPDPDIDSDTNADFDDDLEKAQWHERPATGADQEKRLLRLASFFFPHQQELSQRE
ncbi:MAG: hypothetical protein V1899_01090 [Planctomycetota bacterium]